MSATQDLSVEADAVAVETTTETVEATLTALDKQLAELEEVVSADAVGANVDAAAIDAVLKEQAAGGDQPGGAEAAAKKVPAASEQVQVSADSAPATSPPAKMDGPQSAPKEWLDEAGLDGEASDRRVPGGSDAQLPDVSESAVQGDGSAPARTQQVVDITEPVTSSRLSKRLLVGIACLPFMILALLDAPFAHLSMPVKSVIGYAAIGTLMVAIATWRAGPFLIHS